MSTLVPISAARESINDENANLSAQRIRQVPVVVISPHNQCNSRCAMCDIWRIREAQEITPKDLERQLVSFREFGVQWVVFTGGEPQLNAQFIAMARMVRKEGIRVTMLTAGLLLEPHAQAIADAIDDVIVSLDGPRDLHDRIRRVQHAFDRLAAGVGALRRFRRDMVVRARCTVQKANHLSLRDVVQSAKEIGLDSISFLAADLTSEAFNHPQGWTAERQDRVALTANEADALEGEVERLINEFGRDLDSGFVVESAEKLRRIVRHFRAHLGQVEHVAPRCNAPWVSAVVEASGDVRPCFFHPAFGNIHQHGLADIVNGPEALRFRANLDMATNPICQKCVCSLHWSRQTKEDSAERPAALTHDSR